LHTSVSWGYDGDLRMWVQDTPTTPVSLFLAQPAAGRPPLSVCFTDMSIGCTSVIWDFGNGTGSTERSLRKIYPDSGAFVANLSVNNTNSPISSASAQIIYVQDITPPTGSILINGGAQYTNSQAVTLNISTSGADPDSEMRFAYNNSGPWGEWVTLKSWMPLNLMPGDGPKNVFAQFKDAAGNLSLIVAAGINLDTTPPTGSMTINGGAPYTNTTAVRLNLWADDGGGSGVTSMSFANLVQDPVTKVWYPPVATMLMEPYAASKSWNLSAGDGEKRVAVFFQDAAGNRTSTWAAITLDTTKPAGFSISINGGAKYTNFPQATVSVDAGGQSTTHMRVSFGALGSSGINWGSWQAFKPTYLLDLSSFLTSLFPGSKLPNRTVHARFMDAAENISAPVSAAIDLDTAAPVDGVLTATGGKNQVTLNWSGFSDALSGIQFYKLYCSFKPGLDLSKYSFIYKTGGTTFSHQNLLKGKTYYYWLVAVDRAGNVSLGTTARARTLGASVLIHQLLLQ
jgi:PKD repeat protein